MLSLLSTLEKTVLFKITGDNLTQHQLFNVDDCSPGKPEKY